MAQGFGVQGFEGLRFSVLGFRVLGFQGLRVCRGTARWRKYLAIVRLRVYRSMAIGCLGFRV